MTPPSGLHPQNVIPTSGHLHIVKLHAKLGPGDEPVGDDLDLGPGSVLHQPGENLSVLQLAPGGDSLSVPPHLAVQAGGQSFKYPLLSNIVTANHHHGPRSPSQEGVDQLHRLLYHVGLGGEVVLRPAVGRVQVETVQAE